MHASILEALQNNQIQGMNVSLWLFQPLQKRAIHMAQRMLELHKHPVQYVPEWDRFVSASVVYISMLCINHEITYCPPSNDIHTL